MARRRSPFDPARTRHVIIRCNNLALDIKDCVSLCLSEETLKAFYLVSMPGEVKYPTHKGVTCRGLHILA